MVAFGLVMTYLSDRLGADGLALMCVYLLASLVILGWLLEAGRPLWEWLRLSGSLVLIYLLSFQPWLQSLLGALVAVSAVAWLFVSKQGTDRMQAAL